MRLTTSSTAAGTSSSDILPRLTCPASCPWVTLRASSSPACTRSSLTSLSTTGMPAAAIVCAIWPPMVPAPTTAALKTNMGSGTAPDSGSRRARRLYGTLAFSRHLDPEAAQRAGQRLALRAADEQQVHDRHAGPRLLELVGQLEHDGDPVVVGCEGDPLAAAQLVVLDGDGLAVARRVRDDALLDAPAPARVRLPDEPCALARPVALAARHVVQAVDERRPARRVVPERLGLAGATGHLDARAHAAHVGKDRAP